MSFFTVYRCIKDILGAQNPLYLYSSSVFSFISSFRSSLNSLRAAFSIQRYSKVGTTKVLISSFLSEEAFTGPKIKARRLIAKPKRPNRSPLHWRVAETGCRIVGDLNHRGDMKRLF